MTVVATRGVGGGAALGSAQVPQHVGRGAINATLARVECRVGDAGRIMGRIGDGSIDDRAAAPSTAVPRGSAHPPPSTSRASARASAPILGRLAAAAPRVEHEGQPQPSHNHGNARRDRSHHRVCCKNHSSTPIRVNWASHGFRPRRQPDAGWAATSEN